ncbi:MAG: hypothetical protein IT427_01410 [Pirellulales bacterium]|nr:hypothetical protein [Pirellulales bacterium]
MRAAIVSTLLMGLVMAFNGIALQRAVWAEESEEPIDEIRHCCCQYCEGCDPRFCDCENCDCCNE